MADGAGDDSPGRFPVEEEQPGGGELGGGSGEDREAGLTEAQRVVLERCIRALKEAKKDSQTLAALLLITRLCPASNLDKDTLRRIFEAVGLNLPARLLVAAFKKSDNVSLTPLDILSLGTALLAALSTDSDMALRPQLLSCIPILLGIIANGPTFGYRALTREYAKPQAKCGDAVKSSGKGQARQQMDAEGSGAKSAGGASNSCELDEAMASDCYQVLIAVCAAPNGPDHLVRRGAVVALCLAIENNQTSSHEKGLPLLCSILSSKLKDRVWSKHTRELLDLLIRLCRDFSQASPDARLELCSRLVHFLPPVAVAAENQELREVIGRVWGALRPMIQSKLTPKHIGPILVLSACLLDLCGWQPVVPPKFCCLLVNRACVEIRMGLEGPPGTELSPELQQTLTGCYRIIEAAMEQACNQKEAEAAPQTAIPALSLQQTRQVLRVLEGASNALIYHLQQVTVDQYGDPFVFVTFRCLCSWLAEETSCLKEEVTALLPFLVNYARSHMLKGSLSEEGLADRMAVMFIRDGESWTGRMALRYLLPALCHLSAEEGPRKVLLTLDLPALLVDFLSQSWTSMKEKSRAAFSRNPSMETACSALLNFTVTEPDRVRSDPCFKELEFLLSEALPLLVTKPGLLVLAANYCTLGLMTGRLKTTSSASIEATPRRFLSTALRFLRNALDSSSGPGPVVLSVGWGESWDEVAELWRLSMQALGGCVRVQPAVTALVREEGWLRHTLAMLDQCSALPDPQTQAALEEALCAMAESCSACREEIGEVMKNERNALASMTKLKKSLMK